MENGRWEWARWFRVLKESDQFLIQKLGMFLGFAGAGGQMTDLIQLKYLWFHCSKRKEIPESGSCFYISFPLKEIPFLDAKVVIETGRHLA